MGADGAVIEQAEWVTPAVNGEMVCIAVDATSREYDLWGVALGTDSSKKPGSVFYITISADGNNIYYTTSAAASKTVDDTAAMAATSAPIAFTANAADVIFANTKEPVYIDRTAARYLQLKCAAGKTAVARIRLSSCLRPADTL